jgi:perosamine synthetase
MVTMIVDMRLGLKKEHLIGWMDQRGVDCRPFFHPLSSLPAYAELEEAGKARQRNKVSYQVSPYGLNLPSGFNLTKPAVKYVCDMLKVLLDQRPVGCASIPEVL